jgi:transcriptional regulator with XRE-family HTH domain
MFQITKLVNLPWLFPQSLNHTQSLNLTCQVYSETIPIVNLRSELGGRPALDVCLVIKRRLEKLGLEQKDLATAAEVTESYISQLLARKKLPPAPERTDIYAKMAKFLNLPSDRLSKLADIQRREELKRDLAGAPNPLFSEVREIILRKCSPVKEKQVRTIFERQPFGELERLVTQKLLDVIKKAAKEELTSENWLHLVARLAGRSYEQMRVTLLEFLDTDVFSLSPENCVSFLDPLIESWDVDLTTFSMDIVLNRRITSGDPKRFEFVEKGPNQPQIEPGFKEFLSDSSLSGTATKEEIALLRNLRFNGKRPTPLYYYRELQSLRDPIHFRVHHLGRAKKKSGPVPARNISRNR